MRENKQKREKRKEVIKSEKRGERF